MILPNFFVIGAPKCGTTSLCSYLSEHPEIFVTTPKEPLYFNTDMSYRHYHALSEYLVLYNEVSQNHQAIGEGSTLYLYSNEAVKNIIKLNPDSRIIIMIRNPAEMAYSWHSQLLYVNHETIRTFYEAWKMNGKRKRGENIPTNCPDRSILYYDDICRLGEQIKRVYDHVSKDNVKVILMEEMKQDPTRVYKEVLNFLEVSDSEKRTFPVLNRNKTSRSSAIKRFLDSLGRLKRIAKLKKETGLLSPFHALNTKVQKRARLRPEVMHELQEVFREDITKLSRIADRDLSHWLNVPSH